MSVEELKVRVAVRIRPLLGREKGDSECVRCYESEDGRSLIEMGGGRSFAFDYVFPIATPQSDVFEQVAKPLVEFAFQGYNATMLAYGQTGSGKTFTMGTGNIIGVLQENLGVIPRVATQIFDFIKLAEEHRTFTLSVSFVELYNEEVKDLLDPVVKHIAVREDKHEGIILVGVKWKNVTSLEAMMSLLELGSLSRTTHSTAMNEVSSRSHAIFTLKIEQRKNQSVSDVTEVPVSANTLEDVDEMMTSKFHFVDLAGSERIKRSQAEGERLKEGIAINSGLLALGNVISALGDPTRQASHVPYRDSRLTRLLQDSLGGNSRTLMLACVSPADTSFNETLNTLRYANRARNIQNKAVVNRDPTAMLISSLKKEVADLRLELQFAKGEGDIEFTVADMRRLEEIEKEVPDLKSRVSQLEERLAVVTRERDCYAMKLQASIQDPEEKKQVLLSAQEEFGTAASTAIVEGLGTTASGAVQAGGSNLQQKVLMMRTLLTREQQERLKKMEASISGAFETGQSSDVSTSATPRSPRSPRSRSIDLSSRTSSARTRASSTPRTQLEDTEETDIFDMSELREQEQIERQMEVKLMDEQISALSSNIVAKNQVISNFKTKVVKFEGMSRQFSNDAHTARRQIEEKRHELGMVNRELESGNLNKEQQATFLQQKIALQRDLEDLDSKLHRAELEKKKLSDLKRQSDRKIDILGKEIKLMKEQKIVLSRRMKEDALEWRKFKIDQRKELERLREQLKLANTKSQKLEKKNETLKKGLVNDEKRVTLKKGTLTARRTSSLSTSRSIDSTGDKRATLKAPLDNKKSALNAFVKWLDTGLPMMVEDKSVERELKDEEQNCRLLDEKMTMLRKALQDRKDAGFEVQMDLEDKLDTIAEELKYRRAKIEEKKFEIQNSELPFSWETVGHSDARAIGKICVTELINSKMQIDELKDEIEELGEDLGGSNLALSQLEARIPLQELKMQQYKAELEAEHEEQLWFFMNQIETLKSALRAYEKRVQASGPGKEAELGEESRQIWSMVDELEKLREQRYEDLLERNNYLSQRVAEQAQLQVKRAESEQVLRSTQRLLREIIPALQHIQVAPIKAAEESSVLDPRASRMAHRASMRVDSASGGNIFARLSDTNTFTGMYKVIHDDMNVRGVGHLGGQKVMKKPKKPKREAVNNMLVDAGVLKGHNSVVYQIACTPSNCITCGMDSTIRVWDLAVQKEVALYDEHKGPVRTINVMENMLISTSEDKTLKLFDLRQQKCSMTITLQSPALSVAIGNGHVFTGHEDGSIGQWNLPKSEKPMSVARKHTGSVVALFNTGETIASGSRDRVIWTFDPKNFNFLRQYVHHHDSVTCLASSRGNLISGSRDRQIKEHVYDKNDKDIGHCLLAHSDWVNVIVPTPDDKHFVSGSKDTSIKVWDSETWELKAHVLKHDYSVQSLAWFKNVLVSASHDVCYLSEYKPE